MPQTLDNPPDSAPERVVLGRFKHSRRAHEFGLVVLSQGAHYWVIRDDDRFLLVVEASEAQRLRGQLKLYQRESLHWPPLPPQFPESKVGVEAFLIWLIILFTAYGLSVHNPDWFARGRLSAEAVMQGEWYRLFTALLLHADIGHLAGNMGFGALFLFWLSRQTGGSIALCGTFVAGIAGNMVNVLIYYPHPHFSVGASTAVFGCVAMLTAYPVGAGLHSRWWRAFRVWGAPLVAGLVLLGWFGAGSQDGRTDVSAHLAGFACGIPLGLLAGWWRSHRAEN